MKNYGIEEVDFIIQKFSDCASKITKEADLLLHNITEGRVPSKSSVTDLNEDIVHLQTYYDQMYDTAKACAEYHPIPENAPIEEYANVIAEIKRKEIVEKIHMARAVLAQFISVKSYIANYEAALRPFQDQASELLERIDTQKDTSLFKSDVYTGSKIFLQALNTKDFESETGMQLLDEIEKYYPRSVERGLTREQYYLPEREESSLSQDTDIAQGEKAAPETPAPVSAVKFSSTQKESFSEEKTEVSAPQSEDTSSIKVDTKEDLLYIQNKTKKATPSASGFCKEIVKYPPEVRMFIPMLTNLGISTEEQIFRFGIAIDSYTDSADTKNALISALNYTSEKGLIAKFSVCDTNAYCLAPYTSGCIKKKTVFEGMHDFFRVPFGDHVITTNDSLQKDIIYSTIAYNDLLLTYCEGMKKTLDQELYAFMMLSLHIQDNLYKIILPLEEGPCVCTLFFPGYTITDENILVIGKAADNIGIPPCKNLFEYYDGVLRHNGKVEENINFHTDTDSLAEDSPQNTKEQSTNVAVNTVNSADCDNVASENTEKLSTDMADSQTDSATNKKANIEDLPQDTKEKQENTAGNQTETSNEKLHPSHTEKDAASKLADITSKAEKDFACDDPLLLAIHSTGRMEDSCFAKLIMDIVNGKTYSNGVLSDVMRGTVLAYTASLYTENKQSGQLYRQLAMATNLGFSDMPYTSTNLLDVFQECDDECLILASYLHALLVPAAAYDYGLTQQAAKYLQDFEFIFPDLAFAKSLFNQFTKIQDIIPEGFSLSVLSLLGSASENKKFTDCLSMKARSLLSISKIKTRIKSLPKFYNDCFGKNSDLYCCMDIIAQNKTADYEFVTAILSYYCNVQAERYEISNDKTEEMLDSFWKADNNFNLEYDARQQALRQFHSRLTIMKEWVNHINKAVHNPIDLKRIHSLKKDLVNSIGQTLTEIGTFTIPNINVLKFSLQKIKNYLENFGNGNSVFDEFILTGIFPTDDNGVPIIDSTMAHIKYYEPWRNMLKHIVSPIKTLSQARSDIFTYSSPMFDNLHQLCLIENIQSGEGEKYTITESQIKEAKSAALDKEKKFKENLELAYAYNRISELEKEQLLAMMEQYKDKFFGLNEFGCWRQFLAALEAEISELANQKKKILRRELDARIDKLQEDETSDILAEANRLLENDMNFAVTEEYLNRYDNGEKDFSEDLSAILHDENSFDIFLSDKTFTPLQRECERHSGKLLKSFGWQYLESKVDKTWTVRQKDDSRKLIDNWPIRKGATQPFSINTLFKCLGFAVTNVTKDNSAKEELFKVYVEPTAKSMADYRHPISLFGTQMKSPLNVVVLYGNYAPKQLVDTVSSMDLGDMSVVLIDRPISRAARRQIGEIFHTQTSGQNPFILIDQILLLFLAAYQVTERLPVLLKCTLPYTAYQPFVRDGGSTTDEMFCGRTRELATIIDPKGASVVYGGRQLGKTALLQRAESRRNKPENKEYAIYTNIIDCKTPKQFVKKLAEDISRKSNLKLSAVQSIEDFCKEIYKLFQTGKAASILLLIDEADNFLAGIADEKYKSLQPLIDLKRETTNQFKFVIAGLHNVCRAQNATADNGIFGQLGTPLCIKPLSPTDALQLLSRPLKYLGFQIDRYPHLETILTNTNYYPGILQFFGYMLVQEFNNQYGKYYRASDGHPPFTLKDDQLGAVMDSADLNRSIKDKFRWSLELDPRYFMLARCIAVLYYLRDDATENWLGFSVNEIMSVAKDYDIHCLHDETRSDYINLLDEMVEMGILSKPDHVLYRLRRNSFVNIISNSFDELDAEIGSANEENSHE